MKGSYVLVIEMKKDTNIIIGKKGNIFFKKGFYAYIGSALNGIEQRVNRHLRDDKKFHWHIDYLLEYSEIKKIFYKEKNCREECDIAKKFEKNIESIPGFGCSDCSCKSHLFYSSYDDITQNIKKLNLKEYIF